MDHFFNSIDYCLLLFICKVLAYYWLVQTFFTAFSFVLCSVIFLAGDLNFRIEGLPDEVIKKLIGENSFEPLLQNDQVKLVLLKINFENRRKCGSV